MKVVSLSLVIFLSFSAQSSSADSSKALSTSQSALFYIGGLLKDWNKKHKDTRDVLVINVGKNTEGLENMLKVIPKENPVVSIQPEQCQMISQRKPAFIFIMTDTFQTKKLSTLLEKCYDEPFWSSSTNFIITPTSSFENKDLVGLFSFLIFIKCLNNLVIFDVTFNGIRTPRMLSINLLNEKIKLVDPSTNVDHIFPDKLKDMKGYEYKVKAVPQNPRLYEKNGKFFGTDVLFMETVAQKQNAKLNIKNANMKSKESRIDYLNKDLLGGMSDLNLNTRFSIGGKPYLKKYCKTFNTFDVSGYCALIPIPPRPSRSFTYMFDPYDWMSWFFMFISVVVLAIVWRIFKAQRDSQNLNTVGHMVLLVIAGFLGQALKYRHSRWFHVMVVQIFVFMVLILGNAYQSVLITNLTVQKNATRIDTVDEMMAKDYNYISDLIFYNIIEDLDVYVNMKSKLKMDLKLYEKNNEFFISSAANNTAIIIRCDVANDLLASPAINNTKLSDFYYVLPEKFFTIYETLLTTRFSPFTERLQEFSQRIFESGIKQYWDFLVKKHNQEPHHQNHAEASDDGMLKLKELKFVFILWAVGMSAALIAFIAEQLCYKYREKIENSWIGKLHRMISSNEDNEKREREEVEAMRQRRLRAIIEDETFEMIQCDV